MKSTSLILILALAIFLAVTVQPTEAKRSKNHAPFKNIQKFFNGLLDDEDDFKSLIKMFPSLQITNNHQHQQHHNENNKPIQVSVEIPKPVEFVPEYFPATDIFELENEFKYIISAPGVANPKLELIDDSIVFTGEIQSHFEQLKEEMLASKKVVKDEEKEKVNSKAITIEAEEEEEDVSTNELPPPEPVNDVATITTTTTNNNEESQQPIKEEKEEEKVVVEESEFPKIIHQERLSTGKYYRKYILPKTVDADKISAIKKDGLFIVTVSKLPARKPLAIQIVNAN